MVAVYDTILAATNDNPETIVMDFFAGSGTTGHAILQQNAQLNRTFRYLLVQLDEPIKNNNNFTNIADFTKARMRAAAEKLKKEYPLYKGDLGFRVFKLDSSNIRVWDPQPKNLENELLAQLDRIKQDRTEEDILYELILKFGLDLSANIITRIIVGKTVFSVDNGILITCLDKNISREDAEVLSLGIVDWYKALAPIGETTVIFCDSAFTDDIAKSNLTAILNQNGLDKIRSL